MAVREADAETAVGDDFGEGQLRTGGVDVEVAFYDVQVWRERAQEGVYAGGGEVAEAEDLTDFAGGQKFLELSICCVNIWRLSSSEW